MFKKLLKRLLCCVNVHWSGRTDGGGMGDAIQCDICKCDYYPSGAGWPFDGIVIHDHSKEQT
jgi:hypothetical protein